MTRGSVGRGVAMPERVWGQGLVDFAVARPRAAWVGCWLVAGLGAGPLFVLAMGVLGLVLGRAGATAVCVGLAAGGGYLWFRDGTTARQGRQATGLGGRPLQLLAALVAVAGALLLRVLPVVVHSIAMLCLTWLGAAVMLGALSALALTGRRARMAAAATALVLAASWLPLYRLTLHAADAAVLHSMGSPPRRLVVLVDWPGLQANEVQYRSGALDVEYDDGSPVGGSSVTALQVEPTGFQSPCTVLLRAPTTDPELTYSHCARIGADLWASTGKGSGCALAQQRHGLLLLLTDDLCKPGDILGLASVLRTAHPVGDTALLGYQQ